MCMVTHCSYSLLKIMGTFLKSTSELSIHLGSAGLLVTSTMPIQMLTGWDFLHLEDERNIFILFYTPMSARKMVSSGYQPVKMIDRFRFAPRTRRWWLQNYAINMSSIMNWTDRSVQSPCEGNLFLAVHSHPNYLHMILRCKSSRSRSRSKSEPL